MTKVWIQIRRSHTPTGTIEQELETLWRTIPITFDLGASYGLSTGVLVPKNHRLAKEKGYYLNEWHVHAEIRRQRMARKTRLTKALNERLHPRRRKAVTS